MNIFTKQTLILFTLLLVGLPIFSQYNYGVYGGINFTGEKTNVSNIRTLPIDHGGVNFMGGFHFNKNLIGNLESEVGLNLFSKGFTYEYFDEYGTPHDQYTTIKTFSIPFSLIYYFVPKGEYDNLLGDFKFGIGAGLYTSYMTSGKITEEDGTSVKAGFSNTNRLDAGARFTLKFLFLDHIELFITKELGLTNTIEKGDAILKNNSLLFGLGYQF